MVKSRDDMKTAILNREMPEGRSSAPCNGMLPTSDAQQPNVGYRPSIVVSVSEVRKACHGSRVVVEQPRILQARYTKNFGPGFYCTMLREQAVRWAALGTLTFSVAEEVYDG